MTRTHERPDPLPEQALDKMIDLLEGPVNRALERALSSKIVTAPLSLSMAVGLKLYTKLHGRAHTLPARAHKNGGAR